MDSESTENPLNGDNGRQILAPAEGPRENLISTAVKFLQNPKVMSSPLYQKRAFLEKKGLTQEEINLAIQRSGVKETTGMEVTAGQVAPPPGYQPGMMAVGPHVPPGYVPVPPQSGWARARDLTMTTIVVASVSYGIYQVFKVYLRPWLFGKSAEEERLERLESQIKEIQRSVMESVSELNITLAGIQTSLANQQSQYMIGQGEVRGLADVRSDIASLKGLLLNRNQFPPAPVTSPMLPSWQRAQAPAAFPPQPVPVAATPPPPLLPTHPTPAPSHTDTTEKMLSVDNSVGGDSPRTVNIELSESGSDTVVSGSDGLSLAKDSRDIQESGVAEMGTHNQDLSYSQEIDSSLSLDGQFT